MMVIVSLMFVQSAAHTANVQLEIKEAFNISTSKAFVGWDTSSRNM